MLLQCHACCKQISPVRTARQISRNMFKIQIKLKWITLFLLVGLDSLKVCEGIQSQHSLASPRQRIRCFESPEMQMH